MEARPWLSYGMRRLKGTLSVEKDIRVNTGPDMKSLIIVDGLWASKCYQGGPSRVGNGRQINNYVILVSLRSEIHKRLGNHLYNTSNIAPSTRI
jgi:hypothetical protein